MWSPSLPQPDSKITEKYWLWLNSGSELKQYSYGPKGLCCSDHCWQLLHCSSQVMDMMCCSAWSFSLYSVFVVLFEVFLPALELSGNSGFTVLLMPVAGKGRLVPGSIPSDYAASFRNGVSESWRELLTKVFLLWRRVTKLHTQSVPCLGFGMLKYLKSGKKFVDKSQIIWKWTGFGQCEFKVLKNPAKTFSLGTDI